MAFETTLFNTFDLKYSSQIFPTERYQEAIDYGESRCRSIIESFAAQHPSQKHLKSFRSELMYLYSIIGVALLNGIPITVPIILRSLSTSVGNPFDEVGFVPDRSFLAAVGGGTSHSSPYRIAPKYRHAWWKTNPQRPITLNSSNLEVCLQAHRDALDIIRDSQPGSPSTKKPVFVPAATNELPGSVTPLTKEVIDLHNAPSHSADATPAQSRIPIATPGAGCTKCGPVRDILFQTCLKLRILDVDIQGMLSYRETRLRTALRRAGGINMLYEAILQKESNPDTNAIPINDAPNQWTFGVDLSLQEAISASRVAGDSNFTLPNSGYDVSLTWGSMPSNGTEPSVISDRKATIDVCISTTSSCHAEISDAAASPTHFEAPPLARHRQPLFDIPIAKAIGVPKMVFGGPVPLLAGTVPPLPEAVYRLPDEANAPPEGSQSLDVAPPRIDKGKQRAINRSPPPSSPDHSSSDESAARKRYQIQADEALAARLQHEAFLQPSPDHSPRLQTADEDDGDASEDFDIFANVRGQAPDVTFNSATVPTSIITTTRATLSGINSFAESSINRAMDADLFHHIQAVDPRAEIDSESLNPFDDVAPLAPANAQAAIAVGGFANSSAHSSPMRGVTEERQALQPILDDMFANVTVLAPVDAGMHVVSSSPMSIGNSQISIRTTPLLPQQPLPLDIFADISPRAPLNRTPLTGFGLSHSPITDPRPTHSPNADFPLTSSDELEIDPFTDVTPASPPQLTPFQMRVNRRSEQRVDATSAPVSGRRSMSTSSDEPRIIGERNVRRDRARESDSEPEIISHINVPQYRPAWHVGGRQPIRHGQPRAPLIRRVGRVGTHSPSRSGSETVVDRGASVEIDREADFEIRESPPLALDPGNNNHQGGGNAREVNNGLPLGHGEYADGLSDSEDEDYADSDDSDDDDSDESESDDSASNKDGADDDDSDYEREAAGADEEGEVEALVLQGVSPGPSHGSTPAPALVGSRPRFTMDDFANLSTSDLHTDFDI